MLRGSLGGGQRRRCSGSIAKTTVTSRRRWLHRFTMHSRETEVRQSSTRSIHTATTDIVSSSDRVARKSGDRWSKAILPGNQCNSARDELWRTKRAWIETGGVLRRTTAYGAQLPLLQALLSGKCCPQADLHGGADNRLARVVSCHSRMGRPARHNGLKAVVCP